MGLSVLVDLIGADQVHALDARIEILEEKGSVRLEILRQLDRARREEILLIAALTTVHPLGDRARGLVLLRLGAGLGGKPGRTTESRAVLPIGRLRVMANRPADDVLDFARMGGR